MITVENLKFAYSKSKNEAIKGINFQIPKGQIFGFLGPSGAGKSTTQKILNGLLKGYQGSVVINNVEIAKINRSFYNDIGVVFEFPNLYSKLTALENLKLYASFYNVKTKNPEQLLESVNLQDDKNTKVEAFSKGMKMRLNFVRALLNEPKILFLDEPTSGLDPTNARQMKDIILELKNKGTTIFLTTHNMNDADELCDNLAFIVDGELPVVDSPHALKLKYGKKAVKVEYKEDNSVKHIEFPMENLSASESFLNILKNKEIETIHTLEASLEDIFIKITGKKLT